MYHVYLNWAAGVYLFLYFFRFLSLKSQNIRFFVTLFCDACKVETWYTHGGKRLIYCVHQIQAARICLFLYFSSFFFLSNRLKTCIYKIVSTYLWWLRSGVCELCSLSAIFNCSSEPKVPLAGPVRGPRLVSPRVVPDKYLMIMHCGQSRRRYTGKTGLE